MSASPAEVVAALEHASQRIETPCGEGTMAWRRWGTGPVTVLLHGGSGSWTHWIRTIPALSRTRQVLVPDLPGFGASALPAAPVSLASISAALERGIGDIVGVDERLDIVGFSFGMHVGQVLAERLGPRVRQLVLVAGHLIGPLEMQPGEMLQRWRDVADPDSRSAILKRNLAVLMLAHADNIDALATHIYEADVVRARLRPAPLVNGRDLDLIGRLHCPLAVIAGGLDPLGLPSVAEQQARLRQVQPAARTCIVPDAGHWVAYEAADRFNPLLAEVLESV